VISPEFYNQLGAMHGTIMVFLGVVPLAFGAFGNYIVPLQIGAPDMAFPRLNALSYWLYLAPHPGTWRSRRRRSCRP
jgi:cytochrome c oxidase subunit 1